MPQFVRSSWCALLIALLGASQVHAQSVTLAWDHNTEPDLAGYAIGYGSTPGADEQLINVGLVTQWTLTGFSPSHTYYFRVYAYSTSGMRSGPSQEISTFIGGSTAPGGCATPDPFVALGGGTCVNGNWLPPSSPAPAPPPMPAPMPGGCTTPDPFVALGGGTCVNGNWLPPSSPAPAPAPMPAPVPGGCTTPDPFVALGGGTCHNGNWLPPGMPIPGSPAPAPAPAPGPAPAPAPSTPGGCATPDPFVALGGGTCYNRHWLPPGMPIPGSPAPSPAPAPAPPPAPHTGGCSTPDPFVALGGGTCYKGHWLPPGMPIPSPPAPAPTGVTGCIGPDPFVALGGGICYKGHWLPPDMPIPGTTSGSSSLTASTTTTTSTTSPGTTTSSMTTAGGCTTADPFIGLPGLIGECANGGWVPVRGVATTGTVYSFNVGVSFWGILGDDGQIYRPANGLPSTFQKVRMRVTFEGRLVGEVATPERIVLIDLRKIAPR